MRAALPLQTADDRGGDGRIEDRIGLGGGSHFAVLNLNLNEMKLAQAVLVQRISDPLAIVVQVPVCHVPFVVGQERGVLFGLEIDVGKVLKFRVAIRRDENALARLGEERPGIGNLLFAGGRPRRQFGSGAGLGIEKPEITFVNRDFFDRQQLRTVRRPISNRPAATFDLRQQVISLLVVG